MKLGMKKVAALAAAGSLVGLFGVNVVGGVAAHACPNHSPWGWNPKSDPNSPEYDPNWHGPAYQHDVAGGWTLYASYDPTSGQVPPTSGPVYVGLSGTVPYGGDQGWPGWFETGGSTSNPGAPYAVVGGADGDCFGQP